MLLVHYFNCLGNDNNYYYENNEEEEENEIKGEDDEEKKIGGTGTLNRAYSMGQASF